MYDSLNRNAFKSEIADLWKYKYLVVELAKRNITSRYKRSLLGVFWTLFNPIITTLIMVLVFEILFSRELENFTLFVLSGIIIWTFISEASMKAITEIVFSGGGLMKFIYLPNTIFAIASLISALVNLIISFIPLILLMLFSNLMPSSAFFFLPAAIIIVSFFTLGISLLVSSLAIFFSDFINLYQFALRLGMYLSGIFYSIEMLPENVGNLLRLNPTYQMVTIFRYPFYYGKLPDSDIIIQSFFWALVIFLFGFYVFVKNSNKYAYK